MSKLVTTVQLSEIVNIPVWSIRKMVRERRIPAYAPGKKYYLFDPDEVITALKNFRVK